MSQHPTFYTISGFNEVHEGVEAFQLTAYSPFLAITRGDKFRTPSDSNPRILPPDCVCEVIEVLHHIFESEHPEIEGDLEMEHVVILTLRPV